jgi:hypothetical protein
MDHPESLEEEGRMLASIGQLLRHAVRDGIRDARKDRAERRKARAKSEALFAKLAAAQLITEEKWQQLEEKWQQLIEREKRRYGGNGDHPAAQ